MILLPDANISSIPSGVNNTTQATRPADNSDSTNVSQASSNSVMDEQGGGKAPDLSKVTVFASLDKDSSASVGKGEVSTSRISKGCNMSMGCVNTNNPTVTKLFNQARNAFFEEAAKINLFSKGGGIEVDASQEASTRSGIDNQVESDITSKLSELST